MKLTLIAAAMILSFNVQASDVCDAMANTTALVYKSSQIGVPKYKVSKVVTEHLNGDVKKAYMLVVDSVYDLPAGLTDSQIRNVVLVNCDLQDLD